MAVVIENATGRDVIAREVTPETRTRISEWLHSRGYALFDLASAPDGAWVALLDVPTVILANEFADAFTLPSADGDDG